MWSTPCNRIRGPFNVNAAAIAAGIAAIEDAAHVERARAHNERWLAWLTEEIGRLGLAVTPSVAQLPPDPFPAEQGAHGGGGRRVPAARAGSCCARSPSTGCRTRLRMTVGGEEANRLVVDGAAPNSWGGASA